MDFLKQLVGVCGLVVIGVLVLLSIGHTLTAIEFEVNATYQLGDVLTFPEGFYSYDHLELRTPETTYLIALQEGPVSVRLEEEGTYFLRLTSVEADEQYSFSVVSNLTAIENQSIYEVNISSPEDNRTGVHEPEHITSLNTSLTDDSHKAIESENITTSNSTHTSAAPIPPYRNDTTTTPEVDLITGKKVYGLGEHPAFTLQVPSKNKSKRFLGLVNPFASDEPEIRARVMDSQGHNVSVPVIVSHSGQSVSITLGTAHELERGTYSVEVDVFDGENITTYVEHFQWGVLAYNFDKSSYQPLERAYLSLSVLDDFGRIECEAELEVSITSPLGEILTLSTEDESIQRSATCGNKQSLEDDYFADFTLENVGVHQIEIRALTERGEEIITDELVVLETSQELFEVSRDGPTRLYPVNPYTMELFITPQSDFSGVVEERVPLSFSVSPDASHSVYATEREKIVQWSVDWKGGETYSLSYTFDAPDASPDFFVLGPLRIGNHIDYRSWQLANDAVYNGEFYLLWDGNGAPTNWTCVSCNGGDAFLGRFIRGSNTFGGTGGSVNHTHTITFQTATAGAGVGADSGNPSVATASPGHTHASLANSAVSGITNNPVFLSLNVIRYDGVGIPSTIPAGAIALFNTTTLPSNWKRYNYLDGRFPFANATVNQTGGSNKHQHQASTGLGAATGTANGRGGGSEVNRASTGHTHPSGVSSTSTNVDKRPLYIGMVFAQATANVTIPFASWASSGMVGMFNSTPPDGWNTLSGVGEPLYQRFTPGNVSYGEIGGVDNHTHANMNIVTGATTQFTLTRTGAGATLSADTHVHTVNVSVGNTNNLPQYINVIFAHATSDNEFPNITVNSPSDPFSTANPTINFSASVSDNVALVNVSLYGNWSGGWHRNETNSSGVNGDYTFSKTIADGTYVWSVRACDSSGNCNYSANRTLTIDATLPEITVVNPPVAGYNYSTNVVNFNLTLNEDGDSVSYSLDGGSTNVTMSTLNNRDYGHTNTSLADGSYTIQFYVNDTAGNRNDTVSRSFGVDASPPTVSNFVLSVLNATQDFIGNASYLNSTYLEAIEYVQINFTVFDASGLFGDIDLYYAANGSNACAPGNKNSTCTRYPEFVWYKTNAITKHYDGRSGNIGDSITCSYSGSFTERNYSCTIDEHYNPNVYKHYPFNFTDVVWQNTSQRINATTVWRFEVDEAIVPATADEYKIDFRVQYSSPAPTNPLEIYMCNATYVTGDPHLFPSCQLVAEKLPGELAGTKFRYIFTSDLIQDIGSISWIILETEESAGWYAPKTYLYTGAHPTRTDYSIDHGSSYSDLPGGYESELNLNWVENNLESNQTQVIFKIGANDTLGNVFNSSEYIYSWFITGTDIAPIVSLINPEDEANIQNNYAVNWTSSDPNGDAYVINLTLSNASGNTPIVEELRKGLFSYSWDSTTNADGRYNLTIYVCENETALGLCHQDTALNIIVDNTFPSLTIFSPENVNYTTNQLSLNYSAQDIFLDSCWYTNNSGTTNYSLANCANTSYIASQGNTTLQLYANDSIGHINNTENVSFFVDSISPIVTYVNPTRPNGTSWEFPYIEVNVSVTETNFANITFELWNETGGGAGTLVNKTTYSTQTFYANFSELNDNTVTYYFNVSVRDILNNEGHTATRTLTLTPGDIQPPVITILSPSPNYANVTQSFLDFNISVDEDLAYAYYSLDGGTTNITMTSVDSINYNATNASIADGFYTVTYFAEDLEGNLGSEAYNFTIDASVPVISNVNIYSLNGSETILGGLASFNGTNYHNIEFMQINFTLHDDNGISNNWTLFYTANGSDACALGNRQHHNCSAYPQYISFRDNELTATFDDRSSHQGEGIDCSYSGNSTDREYRCIIDEHYDPSFFKHYPFNLSNVSYLNGTNERLVGDTLWKFNLTGHVGNVIPLDAEFYEINFRVNYSSPSIEPLEVYLCNSTYSVGEPDEVSSCLFIDRVGPDELSDQGRKVKTYFTNASIERLADWAYVVVEASDEVEYYTLKTYEYLGSDQAILEISTDNGQTYTPLSTGYETEFNINWINTDQYDHDVTQFVFKVELEDIFGNVANSSDYSMTWDLANFHAGSPLIDILFPTDYYNASGSLTINWSYFNPDGHESYINFSLRNNSGSYSIANDVFSANENYTFDTSTFGDSAYNLTAIIFELEPQPDYLMILNDSQIIRIDNTRPQITIINPPFNGYYYTAGSVDFNITVDAFTDTVLFSLNNGTSNVSMDTTDGIQYGHTEIYVNDGYNAIWFYVNDTARNTNYTEYRSFGVDIENPRINFSSPTPAPFSNLSQSSLYVNVSARETNFANITYSLYNTTGPVNVTTLFTFLRNFTWTNLSDGTYTYNVSLRDATNKVNTTQTRTVTLDATPPQIQFGVATENNATNFSRNYIFVNTTYTEPNFINVTFTLFNTTNGQTLVNSTTFTSEIYNLNFTNLADGTYLFNVSVYDVAGNFNSTETRTQSLDDTSPIIHNISEYPDTLARGSSVTLSANITDNLIGVDSVRAYINGTAYSLSLNSSGTYEVDINTSGFGFGYFTFEIEANDSLGNYATNQSNQFRVVYELNAPVINSINATPNPVSFGLPFNITANVTDDTNISLVWVNIEDTNYTMSLVSGDLYVAESIDSLDIGVGNFTYTVYANDTSSNLATPASANISIEEGSYVSTLAVRAANPDPIDRDREGLYGVILFNPTDENITVTSVIINASGATGAVWAGLIETAGNAYPTDLAWSLSNNRLVQWTGSYVLRPKSTEGFYVTIDSNSVDEVFTVEYAARMNNTRYDDPHSHTSQIFSSNNPFVSLAFTDRGVYPTYNVSVKGGVERTYNITLAESTGRAAIPANVQLSVEVPDGFTSVKHIGGTGWGTATISGTVLSVNTTQTVTNGQITYSFNATAPTGTAAQGTYVMVARMSGTNARAELEGGVEVFDGEPPEITLEYPLNFYNVSSTIVNEFNYSVSDTSTVTSCVLYGNWSGSFVSEQTDTSPSKDTTNSFSAEDMVNDGYYFWNVECTDAFNNAGFATINQTFGAFDYPNAPQFSNITQSTNDGTGSITLHWNQTGHVWTYRVYEGPTLDSLSLVNITKGTNYTDNDFSGNIRKYYYVEADNPTGTNRSTFYFGAHVYELYHATNTKNWISFPSDAPYLQNANETLHEIRNATAFTMYNETLQQRTTCNQFTCPSFPSCTNTTCNFDLHNGRGYEVNINTSAPSPTNWSLVGQVQSNSTVQLVKNTTDFGKNWIGLYANTSLLSARNLLESISTADAVTQWDAENQISRGYIRSPFPFGPEYLGTNFLLRVERGYEVSVNASTSWARD